MKTSTLWVLMTGATLWTSGVVAEEQRALPVAKIDRTTTVDFEKEILPFLRKNCLSCHNDSEAKGDVVLETPRTIRDGHDDPIVIPGEADDSLLFKVAAHAEKPVMPPKKNKTGAKDLTPEQLALLKLWIDQGAKGEVSRGNVKVEWFPLPPGVHPVYAISLAPDAGSLVCSRANQIFVYDLDDGQVLQRLTDPDLASTGVYTKPGVAHLDHVQDLAMSGSGRLLASSGYRCVKLWTQMPNEKKRSWKLGADGATAVASSTDGSLSATGTEKGVIHIWRTGADGQEQTLEGHASKVTGLGFSADGKTLLSTNEDGTVAVWDIQSAKRLLHAQAGAPLAGAVLIDGGASIAAAGGDGKVYLWKVEAAGDGLKVTAGKPLAGHKQAVTSVALVPSAPSQIVSASADGDVVHWDTSSGNEIRRLQHGAPITSVAVRPDGQRLATCGADAALRLWNLADGKEVASRRGEALSRHRAAQGDQRAKLAAQMLEASGKQLAATEGAVKKAEEEAKKATEALAAADKTVGEKRQAVEAADKEQATLSAEPDESKKDKDKIEAAKKKAEAARKELANAEKAKEDAGKKLEDANLQMRRDKEALELAKVDQADSETRQKDAQEALKVLNEQLAATQAPLRAVAFSGDGRRLAAVDENGTIHVLGAQTGTPVSSIDAGSKTLRYIAFTPSRDVLVVDDTGSATEWEPEARWTLMGKIEASEDAEPSPFVDRVTALAFHPDESLLATGDGEPSRSGNLKVWNVADRSLLWAVNDAHSDTISDIQFSYDGKYIATAGTDKFVRVFSAEDGKLVKSLEGHTGHVLGVAWQADGKSLASCGADNVVKVWDVEKGEQRQTIAGYGKQVTAIRFVGIGGEAISCSGDRSVRRHQVDNRKQVRTFDGSSEFLHCLSVTPDGGFVAAGDQNGVIRVWNANDGKQVLTLEPPKAE